MATRPRGHHMAVAGFQRHEGRPYTLAHHVRRDRPDELPLLSSVMPRRSVHTAAFHGMDDLTAGGCDGEQIEQSADVRDGHWAEVADAVAAVYARHVGTCHAGVVPLSVSTRTRSSISLSRNQDRTGSTPTAGSPDFRPSCGPGAPATVLRRVGGR